MYEMGVASLLNVENVKIENLAENLLRDEHRFLELRSRCSGKWLN